MSEPSTEARWTELLAAVSREFIAHQHGSPAFDHQLHGLHLRARRRGVGGGSANEWFEVRVSPEELARRPVQQIAREFYQGYYACT
jgi:hypothetical protein